MNKFSIKEEVMSPRTTGLAATPAGGSTPVKEGDLARIKGDRDGHKFRVMRVLEKCANICCAEHTSVDFLIKVEE